MRQQQVREKIEMSEVEDALKEVREATAEIVAAEEACRAASQRQLIAELRMTNARIGWERLLIAR